jgi:hypothetical protein
VETSNSYALPNVFDTGTLLPPPAEHPLGGFGAAVAIFVVISLAGLLLGAGLFLSA